MLTLNTSHGLSRNLSFVLMYFPLLQFNNVMQIFTVLAVHSPTHISNEWLPHPLFLCVHHTVVLLLPFFLCFSFVLLFECGIHTVTTTTHQQQQCRFSPLFSLVARLLFLYGVAVCLLLQCSFASPAGVARLGQPGPGTRRFHDSGAACLANLPAVGV